MSLLVLGKDDEKLLHCRLSLYDNQEDKLGLSSEGNLIQIKSLRPYNEQVSNAILRMKLALKKKLQGKKKIKKNATTNPIDQSLVLLLWDEKNQQIDENMSSYDALYKAKRLTVNGFSIPVTFNGPCMDKVLLAVPRVNCRAYAEISTLQAEPQEFIVEWYHCCKTGDKVVGNGFFYRPTPDLVGECINVKVWHPSLPLHFDSCSSNHKVLPALTDLPILNNKRVNRLDTFSKLKSSDKDISVLSFNILADAYARTPRAKHHAFPYCEKDAVAWAYRRGMIVEELDYAQADIIGLQEVSRHSAYSFLKSFAVAKGYTGVFKAKLGRIREGEMLLLKSDRFQLVKDYSKTYKDVLADLNLPKLYALWRHWFPRYEFDDLQHLSTIFQVLHVLDLKNDNKHLLIVNTHLFFHPLAAHTRLLQYHSLMEYVHHLRHSIIPEEDSVEDVVKSTNGTIYESIIDFAPEREYIIRGDSSADTVSKEGIPVILVGDLNATRGSLVAQYVNTHESPEASSWLREYNCQHTFAAPLNEAEGEEVMDDEELNKQEEIGDARNKTAIDKLKYPVSLMECSPEELQSIDMNDKLKNPMNDFIGDVYREHQSELLAEDQHLVWTNRVRGFCEQLDYIGASDSFQVKGLMACPQGTDDFDCPDYEGIPNETYPSDHISIGAVLSWRDSK